MQKEFRAIEKRLTNAKIQSKVGQSALGRSYKIEHEKYGECLLKVISGKVKKNQKFIERFFKDLQKSLDFSHPNIGKVYEIADINSDMLYIIRELVEGIELQQWIYGKKQITIEEGNKVLLQATSGLGFLHSQGVIYRNLKPNNFILDDQMSIKLVDFSLPPTLAQYLSPEQCKGKKSDVRSDIYALGSIYFYYLTGRTIFVGATSREIMEAHVTQQAPNIQQYRDDISDNMTQVFNKMTAKKSDERYQNCQELFFDIKDAAKIYENSYQTPDLQKIEHTSETTETSTIQLVRNGNSWTTPDTETMDTSTIQLIRAGNSWKLPNQKEQIAPLEQNQSAAIDISPNNNELPNIDISSNSNKLPSVDISNIAEVENPTNNSSSSYDINPSGNSEDLKQNYNIDMSTPSDFSKGIDLSISEESYSTDLPSNDSSSDNYSININPTITDQGFQTAPSKFSLTNEDTLKEEDEEKSLEKTGHFLAVSLQKKEEPKKEDEKPEMTIELPSPEITMELPGQESLDSESEDDSDTFAESSLFEIYVNQGTVDTDDTLETDNSMDNEENESKSYTTVFVSKNQADEALVSSETLDTNLNSNELQSHSVADIKLDDSFHQIPSITITEQDEVDTAEFENPNEFSIPDTDNREKTVDFAYPLEEVKEKQEEKKEKKEKTADFSYTTGEIGMLPTASESEPENQHENAAVLFSNIKLYCSSEENADGLVESLNSYMEEIETIVERNKGQLNKCLGNQTMSLFDQANKKNHSWLAIKTALKVKSFLEKNNVMVNSAIHEGNVLKGKIGSSKTISTTIAGHNVDMTSSLVRLCTYYSCSILITESALLSCKNHVVAREIDYIELDGFPTKIYEVIALASDFIDEEIMRRQEMYAKARRLYFEGKFALALEKFITLFALTPQDVPCELHMKRCIHFVATPPKKWDGIWQFKI